MIWISKACHWLDRVLSAISNVSDDAELAIAHKQQISQWVVDQNELLEGNAPIGTRGMAYSRQFDAYKEMSSRLNTTIDTQSEDVFKAAGDNNYFLKFRGSFIA
ncbi:hypothetical protein BMETH_314_0 [methanotrophic bacterial endosymbiont of Bathymodiolus sp.]|nr:hypothetical protein BMETH_314_0 [methanotrophic bacterial endosymbiont of Bathymodiolus sp.]